jgi:hypothetical protein
MMNPAATNTITIPRATINAGGNAVFRGFALVFGFAERFWACAAVLVAFLGLALTFDDV